MFYLLPRIGFRSIIGADFDGQEVELTLSNKKKVSGVLMRRVCNFSSYKHYALMPNVDSPVSEQIGCWDETGEALTFQPTSGIELKESKIKQDVLDIELKGQDNGK